MPYTSLVPMSFHINKDHELAQISRIHQLLTHPFHATLNQLQEEDAVDETQL